MRGMVYRLLALILMLGCLVPDSAAAAEGTRGKLRFKVVYLDLDGTALADKGGVRPATREALERFRQCGGRVGIATGRFMEQARKHLSSISPNLPIILNNGAVIMDPTGTHIILSMNLDSAVVEDLIKNIDSLGMGKRTLMMFADRVFANATGKDLAELNTRAYSKATGCPSLARCLQEQAGEMPQKILFLVDAGKGDKLVQALTPVLKGRARAIVTGSTSVEVVGLNVSKGEAIRRVLDLEGMDPQDVATFGDSANDLEMLRDFPLGVAMGNCRRGACEAALVRCGDNNTDAIAEVIERLILTSECPGLK